MKHPSDIPTPGKRATETDIPGKRPFILEHTTPTKQKYWFYIFKNKLGIKLFHIYF